jgi:catechol 2,3-dioxygenase-like lactoylglutathione lyase family enzyme
MAIEIKGLAPYFEVFDMPTSLQFYRDKLGFEVVGSDNEAGDPVNWVLLRLNGVDLMLNTQHELSRRPPAPDPARRAAHRDTVIYFGCPDVDAAYEHLRAHGVDLKEPQITQYGFKAIRLADPDGYGLCFHWPKT